MEPYIPTQPTPPLQTPRYQEPVVPTHHKPARRTIIAIVLLLAAIAAIWYGWQQKQKEKTPMDTLLDLKKSSAPVTATPEERTDALKGLESSSTPVEQSYEARMRAFDNL